MDTHRGATETERGVWHDPVVGVWSINIYLNLIIWGQITPPDDPGARRPPCCRPPSVRRVRGDACRKIIERQREEKFAINVDSNRFFWVSCDLFNFHWQMSLTYFNVETRRQSRRDPYECIVALLCLTSSKSAVLRCFLPPAGAMQMKIKLISSEMSHCIWRKARIYNAYRGTFCLYFAYLALV